jgi:hypothetical protein
VLLVLFAVGDDATRIAKTESLFREVNERIAESAGAVGLDDAEFVCECADPTCTERVNVELDEYEAVRNDSTQFLLAPGHELSARVERVIQRKGEYQVVRKVHDAVVAIVRRLDPRTNPA